MFQIARSCLVISLVTALSASVAAAQSGVDLAELTEASALVVSGRVLGVSSQWDPAINGIYTYAVVEVDEVWKGALDTRQIVVKVLGGRVGNIELEIYGQARLTAGTTVALWLDVRPRDGTLYPAALAESVRELTDDLARSLRSFVQSRPQSPAVSRSFQAVPPEWQPGATSSFTLGPAGGPARWHEADRGQTVPVDYQTPSGYGGGVAEIDNAIAAWNGSGMRLRLERRNQRGARCLGTFENGGDGRITVSFGDPCGEVSDTGTVLGMGGGYFTDVIEVVNGQPFKQFIQGAVMLNPVANAPALAERGCFQEALMHNLGHAIGLGDSADTNAIMHADFGTHCSGTARALAADDLAGIRHIYPAPPSAPQNLVASANGTTVTLTWSPPQLGPVTNYIVEAGFASGQTALSISTNSTVPGAVFQDVPPGFYFVRVRAVNAIGIGAASNEVGLPVACTPPQAPSNLSFTALANNVTFTWNPPASGHPAAYVLAVGSAPGSSDVLRYQFPPATSLSAVGIPGTFFVRLHSVGSCGESAPSNQVTVTLPAPCVTPTAPQNFTFSVAPNRTVTLNWAAPAAGSAPFTYLLEVGSAPGLSNVLIAPVGAITHLQVPGVPPGTYFVRVRAVNPCGTPGNPSTEQTITVP